LSSKFPGYLGADVAPGASIKANAADEGSCMCIMSNTYPLESLETPQRITGNNGSVSCRRFCNGSWGKDRLSGKFPDYLGADLAPGASNTANAADGGSCMCLMSNTYPWESLETPQRITGNNGSVSCRRFCNGSWGKDRLSGKFPDYAGADLAPGASNTANAADEGSCMCLMSNSTPWNTLNV